MKKKITATVLSQKEIAPRIFDMWIATELAACAKAGQFIGVYPKDRKHSAAPSHQYLPGKRKKRCPAHRVPYRRTGHCGIFFLSGRRRRRDFGNLGNGFPTEAAESKRYSSWAAASVFLPCWNWPESFRHPQKKQIIVGYRDDQLFLKRGPGEKRNRIYCYGRRQ